MVGCSLHAFPNTELQQEKPQSCSFKAQILPPATPAQDLQQPTPSHSRSGPQVTPVSSQQHKRHTKYLL